MKMGAKSEAEYKNVKNDLETMKAEFQEFTYAVSHDLRAPLRQIEGFADIVLTNHGDNFDDKTKRHFDLIVSGAHRGQSILDALQGYAQLMNRQESFAEVNCNTVIEDVKSELSTMIVESNAEISHKELPVITGDSSQIHLLFYHLIHNALHYQNQDYPPVISIATSDNEGFWEFSITDNGTGMQQKVCDRIFTVLKRAVSEKEFTGIGMGLTLARAVAQRHGGTIWVNSTVVGEGSELYFTLAKGVSLEKIA